ncbi:MAG TPA: hypothetical protein VJT67_09540 [Longimicrobiaceae bacterium]|nr:hypothetical protein [Longimicrobiaceae bacterium]
MTTLTTNLPGSAATGSTARTLLERAVAEAPSHIPAPRGLRRLFARDRSAAGLIRRYRLWPAIEHAYERVTREFGPVDVDVSAEDGDGTEFVMVTFLCHCLDFDQMYDAEKQVSDESLRLMFYRHWYRLVISLDPHPDLESDE